MDDIKDIKQVRGIFTLLANLNSAIGEVFNGGKVDHLILPSELEKYDPDPSGRYEMGNQRRLDTAFEAYKNNLYNKLSEVISTSIDKVI